MGVFSTSYQLPATSCYQFAVDLDRPSQGSSGIPDPATSREDKHGCGRGQDKDDPRVADRLTGQNESGEHKRRQARQTHHVEQKGLTSEVVDPPCHITQSGDKISLPSVPNTKE